MWRVRGGGDCKPEDKEAAENFVLRWVGENLEEVSLRNIHELAVHGDRM